MSLLCIFSLHVFEIVSLSDSYDMKYDRVIIFNSLSM